ncbi:MAG: glycosyltransferase family 2 protein [Deltaproteobacteria bacterium]|nr:glycosyltransferase family 2 protein [Deltaproteobacteria bacterium]
MTAGNDHISVCICTFKRPLMLANLLEALQHQAAGGLFSLTVVVVDNDEAQSARSTVEACKIKSSIPIEYDCEPEQNIALARNRAVRNAKGNVLAFIDDDEFPDEGWLLNFYNALLAYKADAVLGPVKPHFETAPPSWILKGRICERKSFKTGTVLRNASDTRTGNVLLQKELFRSDEDLFRPVFGRTGGEDVDFFRRFMAKGCVAVWCDEAVVYETVPPERLEKKYYLKRALLRGKVTLLQPSLKTKAFSVLKSIIAVAAYTLMLPVCIVLGEHVFMKYLIKYCDHIGKLLAVIGIMPVRERSF